MDPKLIRMAAAIMRPLIRQNKAFLEYSSGPGAAPLAGAGNFIPQRFRFFSATQTEGKPNSTGDGASSDESGGGDSKALIELQEQLSKAVAERDTLASKSREFEDKYMRALAETENVRNRMSKQLGDMKLYAIQGFCKDMAEISDVLKMAIDATPKDQLTDNNPHLKNLFDGLTMTENRLLQVFKSHGLVSINPVDQKFNPNEHEAVAHQAVDGKESGMVIFVSQLGYKLHDRVIRPAVVGVAK